MTGQTKWRNSEWWHLPAATNDRFNTNFHFWFYSIAVSCLFPYLLVYRPTWCGYELWCAVLKTSVQIKIDCANYAQNYQKFPKVCPPERAPKNKWIKQGFFYRFGTLKGSYLNCAQGALSEISVVFTTLSRSKSSKLLSLNRAYTSGVLL